MDKTQLVADLMTGVGASESPILLLGGAYGKTIEDVYNVKRGYIKYDIGGPDIERGEALEDTALEKFESEMDTKVIDRQLMLHNEEYHMLCHLDGRAWARPVEAKCPRSFKYREVQNKGVPDLNQIQLQHQMALSGAPSGYMVYFCADSWELHIVEVPRSDALIEVIRDRCKRFWEGVLRGELVLFEPIDAPPPLGALAAEYQDDMAAWLDQLKLCDDSIDALKEDRVTIMEKVAKLWPEKHKKLYGALGSFSKIYQKPSESLDKKRFVADHPKLWEKYKRTNKAPAPRIQPYWKKEKKT